MDSQQFAALEGIRRKWTKLDSVLHNSCCNDDGNNGARRLLPRGFNPFMPSAFERHDTHSQCLKELFTCVPDFPKEAQSDDGSEEFVKRRFKVKNYSVFAQAKTGCDDEHSQERDSSMDDELIYSFSIGSCGYKSVSQKIDLLGSQTIAHLCQIIYCVQTGLRETLSEPGSILVPSAPFKDDDDLEFVFLNNICYVNCDEDKLVSKESKLLAWHQSVFGGKVVLPNSKGSDIGTKTDSPQTVTKQQSWNAVLLSATSRTSSFSRKRVAASAAAVGEENLANPIKKKPALAAASQYTDSGPTLKTSLPFRLKSARTSVLNDEISSLDIRDAYFVHLGMCSHQLSLLDIHLFHPAVDNSDTSMYPLVTYQSKMHRRSCCVCDSASAEIAAYSDPLAESNPAHFCK